MTEELDKLEKNFEVFSQGVERLQNIERELANLNTNGFENEVSQIRSELHNVSEIPIIEQQMKELKEKIQAKTQQNGLVETNGFALKKFNKYMNTLLDKLEQRFSQKLDSRVNEINEKILELKESINANNSNGHTLNPRPHEMIRLRIEANLDKLKYIETMPTLMSRIQTSENAQKSFEFLLNFYYNFKKAIETKQELNQYKTTEQQLEQHLEYFNKIIIQLSETTYNNGREDYENLKSHVRASERTTKNPYYSSIMLNLI